MNTFLLFLIAFGAILLILLVLVQNPKGGLSANFSSSNQFLGVRKTTDFLETTTWVLASILMCLSIFSSGMIHEQTGEMEKSRLEEKLDELPTAVPSLPAPTKE